MADASFPRVHGGRFATTRWSLVLAAGQAANPRSTEALTSLCEMYWYPVYAFIRRRGYPADDCADLTQGFFARVLEKNYFQDADPARGRFRAFLCSSIRHFLSNERDRQQTLKRGGNQPSISLDLEMAEGRYQLEPRHDLTPEKLFDRQCALIVLERVLAHLREEHLAAGNLEQFDRLKGFLTGNSATAPYADIGRTLGISEGAVKVAVHRLRRRFRDTLIRQIAETVSDPADIDAEIGYLLQAVSM